MGPDKEHVMRGHHSQYVAALLRCCCLLLCMGHFAPVFAQEGDSDLVLKDARGVVLFSFPAPEGFVFGIRYIHSVAKSPVEDWFQVANNVIFLEKTIYQDFGAGLPHTPQPGQTMTTADGHIVIKGYHMALPSFDVRVGRVAQHVLLLPQAAAGCEGLTRQIPLAELAVPGSAITFAVAAHGRTRAAKAAQR